MRTRLRKRHVGQLQGHQRTLDRQPAGNVGADVDVDEARPILDAMSSRAIHVGPSGAGNIAKLVINLLVAAYLVTTGDAMRLSQAAGLSAEDALKVVNTATGRSAISEVMFPAGSCRVRSTADFPPG